MRILLFISILTLAILLISKKAFYSAKKTLFKDQAAWSGKDIIIKHRKPKENETSKGIDNYLEIIADESKVYLENQYRKEEE